jgi:hypothetical protein
MTTKDIPSNWPDYLDIVIENLNNRILPSLKYLPNELMLGLIVNSRSAENPDNIGPPTEEEIDIHMALVEQQRLDGYSSTVDHATRRKATFDSKLQKRAPRIVVFQPGDLVQVHETKWVHTFAAIKKLIPMWSIPHRIATRQVNSYTLETLAGLPLAGVYNSRRLRQFLPREGTRLALNELARMEEVEENELQEGEEEEMES